MGFLKDLLFGSDTSQEAFRLNQANILAGVQALTSAGEEGLPLLREIAPFLATAFSKSETQLTPFFEQARQASMMGRVSGQAAAQEAYQQGMAQSNVSSLYNTSLRQQSMAQLAGQLQKGVMYSEAQTGQQLADLWVKEGAAKADLQRTSTLAQADAMSAIPAYMKDLAAAEAAMRGGISYQGSTSTGLLGAMAQGWAAAATAAAMTPCWVAREVYGEQNPKWIMFREWLFGRGPRWLRWVYLRYGERFAEFISNKPRLKILIRRWMDSRINYLWQS